MKNSEYYKKAYYNFGKLGLMQQIKISFLVLCTICLLLCRNSLQKVFAMCRLGLTFASKESSAHAALLRTLHKSQRLAWLVIANQGFSHFIYLVAPLLLTIFGNGRYLPTTPGDTYGKNGEQTIT